MSYNTRFTLEWTAQENYIAPPPCPHQNRNGANYCDTCGVSLKPLSLNHIVSEYIGEHEFMVERNGSSSGLYSWQNCEIDIRNMSIDIPNVLFHLSGKGEDAEDIWDFYALNGKSQKHFAEIIHKPVDDNAWE